MMRSFEINVLIATLMLGAATPVAAGVKQLRFLSYSIRDRLPSIEEAQAYHAGTMSLDSLVDTWLESDDHKRRIRRYFEDQFGVSRAHQGEMPGDGLFLNAQGVYYRGSDCGAAGVEAEAWWLEPSEKTLICPDLKNDTFWAAKTPHGKYTTCRPAYNGQTCGCGPKLIFCYPRDRIKDGAIPVEEQWLIREWPDRGLYAYTQDLSWNDLFAGRFVYGNRYLGYAYFNLDYHDLYLPGDVPPADVGAEIDAILDLPISSAARLDLSGPNRRRWGVSTMQGIAAQNATDRSRVRELVAKLLCKEMTGALNTDGIDHVVNNSRFEGEAGHGAKPACAGCHNVLDNMASVYSHYYQNHTFITQVGPTPDDTGHIFGREGNGPGFLIDQLLEHSEFHPCMARRVWESFAGLAFSTLAPVDQASFTRAAVAGPRTLIRSILTSPVFRGLRAGD